MIPAMLRRQLILTGAVAALGLAAAIPAATAAATTRPVIKDSEVGYFGSATIAHQIDVFVYTNLGPRAGDKVTVCLDGRCERARGHNASLNWYQASFSTRGLRMGQAVHYTATAADAAGSARISATRGLLCMHNNGSTPQS
jgi:hypothetical protein